MVSVQLFHQPGQALTIRLLGYADDIALCSHTVEGLNEAIERIQGVGASLGLSINGAKSKAVWMSNRPDQSDPVVIGVRLNPM